MKHPECNTCGSSAVYVAAHAEWNFVDQEWVLHSSYEEDAYCEECETITKIKWVEKED